MFKISRRVGAVVAVATLAIGGGVAYAWTVGGGGSASATTAAIQPLEIFGATVGSADAPPYPGHHSDLTVQYRNKNLFPVKVTALSVVADPTSEITVTCFGSGSFPVTLSTPFQVDAATTAHPIFESLAQTYTGLVTMDPNAPTTCAHATFSFTVTATAASA